MATNYGKGDLLAPLEITLTQDGAPFALVGGDTLKLRWTVDRPEKGGVVTEVTPVVVTPPGTDGKIRHEFTAGQTDVVGIYYGQVTVTRSGKPLSFPDDGSWYIWSVNPRI